MPTNKLDNWPIESIISWCSSFYFCMRQNAHTTFQFQKVSRQWHPEPPLKRVRYPTWTTPNLGRALSPGIKSRLRISAAHRPVV